MKVVQNNVRALGTGYDMYVCHVEDRSGWTIRSSHHSGPED